MVVLGSLFSTLTTNCSLIATVVKGVHAGAGRLKMPCAVQVAEQWVFPGHTYWEGLLGLGLLYLSLYLIFAFSLLFISFFFPYALIPYWISDVVSRATIMIS